MQCNRFILTLFGLEERLRNMEYHPFVVSFKTDVGSVIRGHHVYMSIWSPTKGEVFLAFPDSREEAKEYDKFSIEDHRILVGHIPIEISSLCFHFLNQSPDNRINATITDENEKWVWWYLQILHLYLMTDCAQRHSRKNCRKGKTFLRS